MADGVTYVMDTRKLDEIIQSLKGQHVKVVADQVAYGVYWELGHHASRVGFMQHPFLVPACEQMRDPFSKALKQAMGTNDITRIDKLVENIARDVQRQAILEIGKVKQKYAGGSPTDLYDTGALSNSIDVFDPEAF
jgi:hypothetical protein